MGHQTEVLNVLVPFAAILASVGTAWGAWWVNRRKPNENYVAELEKHRTFLEGENHQMEKKINELRQENKRLKDEIFDLMQRLFRKGFVED